MIDLFNLIVFVVAAVLITLLTVGVIRLRLKNRKLVSEALQLAIDKVVLYTQLEKLNETNDIKSVEETQGFVKFLSESREWAFGYIEEVQAAITEYKEVCETSVHDLRYKEAYEKLLSFLPENTES